ncbi:hypothetical protein RND71_035926 [Anisodus tanguticus]|uniref:Uncharacterized protein n=1 Tax=Anisodus tanguticus TaxID=243964 RepID=A0AAE1R5Y5_9SOLA|nr:hypothetical protein RND71_035926 [Anisodus tanguticus]
MDCFFRLFRRQSAYGTSSYLVTRSSCRGTYGRIRHLDRNCFKIGNLEHSVEPVKTKDKVDFFAIGNAVEIEIRLKREQYYKKAVRRNKSIGAIPEIRV